MSATVTIDVPAPAPRRPITPSEVAGTLARRESLWRPLVRFAEPRYYVRLLAAESWEAWLLCWLPGQTTGLHDHGGSAGAFTVLAGCVDESVPILRPVDDARLGGALDDRQGDPVVLGRTSRRLRAGDVRAFGPEHVHDVTAVGRRAITLHVYAPALERMTRYRIGAGDRLETLSRERAGADW